jgi:hypothetical protein
MRSYLLDFFPAIRRFNNRLDNLTQILNKHWILFDDSQSDVEIKFIFLNDSILYVSKNGIIQENCSWAYIDEHYIKISYNNTSYLLQFGLIDRDNKVLIFKLSGTENYIILQNEIRRRLDLSIEELLSSNYLNIEESNYINSIVEVDYTCFNPEIHRQIAREIDKVVQNINEKKSRNSNYEIDIAKDIVWIYMTEHRILTTHDYCYRSLIHDLTNSVINISTLEEILNNRNISEEFKSQIEIFYNSKFI